MSDIDTLAARVTELSDKFDFWNNAGLVFLAITALAAVGIFICQRLTVIRGSQLSDAQQSLSRAKDAKLTIDLRDKDAQIEGLRSQNLKLTEQIQPRSLTIQQQRDIANALRAFRGMTIIVTSHAYDPEGYNLSRQIIAALQKAQIKVDDVQIGRGGVSGMGSFDTATGVAVRWPDDKKHFGMAIADALDNIGGLKNKSDRGHRPGSGEVSVTVNWKPFELVQ